MIICCRECGFQKEIDGRNYRREICPKCNIGFLTPDKGRVATVVKEAEEIVEAKKLPDDIQEIANRSGRDAVKELVKRGKDLNQIIELMEGQLQPTTIRCYYGYAHQELRREKNPAPSVPPSRPTQTALHSTTRTIIKSVPFTIYEEDLGNLTEDDFNEVWQAIGKIVRIMGKAKCQT